jgi:glycine/D-amino acid oxidase-like deaminating enzyme
VRLYEQSRVQSYDDGEVRCPHATLRAELVIHATEAYRVEERHHRRDFLPIFSMMIATEPLPEPVWRELGWVDGLTVVDKHHLYYDAQRTPDGRIALGGRGAHHRLRQPLAPENERDRQVFRSLVHTLHDSFPATRGARLTHHWGGAIAVPRDWCMRVSLERAHKTGFVGGFGGHGVVAANIAGRTMRDLILRSDTELVTFPWVNHRGRAWEPEPLPLIASRLIVKTLESADAHEDGHQRAARRVKLVAPFLPPY